MVSAKQMLDWLDGRDGSSFKGVSYSGNERLQFTVRPRRAPARGLQGMLPATQPERADHQLHPQRRRGALSAPIRRVKGIDYAVFDGAGRHLPDVRR